MADNRKTRRQAARLWVRAEARKLDSHLGRPERFKEVPGVLFHCVGQNASHCFYFGWDRDGGLWRGSLGESFACDENGNPELDEIGMVPLKFSYRRIDPENPGYCGHR
jgi:hypothetical protein